MSEMIEALRKNISRANAAYFQGKPEVSDTVYDTWKKQLRKHAPQDPLLTQVGATYSRDEMRNKTKHNIVCGSLDNLENSIDGYADWLAALARVVSDTAMVLSLKIDGSSLILTYKNGQLVRACTRGNGEVGENVTANAVLFRGVPTTLQNVAGFENWSGDIRGEAVLYDADFKALTADRDEDDVTNPRNIGNGIVGRTDGTDAERMQFLAFSLVPEGEKTTPFAISKSYEVLAAMGLDVVPYRLCKTAEEAAYYFEDTIKNRANLPFGIDGLVGILDSFLSRSRFITDDPKTLLRPKFAKAIKPPVQAEETVLLGCTLSVGHSGVIAPTGVVKPVNIGGVMVTNVFLNNWDEIERFDLNIGDRITVSRAGDVIPKVIGAEPGDSRTAIPRPEACPSCGGPISRRNTGEGLSAHHYCTNQQCPGIRLAKIDHWIGSSKKGIGILGIGEAILQKLFNERVLDDAADLYTLTVDRLARVNLPDEGRTIAVGESRAQSIVESINSKRELPLHVFLGGLGIDLLGSRRALQMIQKSNGALASLDGWLDDRVLESIQMPGFGETQRAAIRSGMDFVRPLVQKLLANGVVPVPYEAPKKKVGGKVDLSGKSFCFTGTREGLEEVQAAGGEIKSGVSKGLTYLVQKDATSMSNKTKKAIEYGTKIMGIDFLRQVLDGKASLDELDG